METTREIALRTYKDATAHGMMDTPMNWHIWKRAFDTAERGLKNLQLGAVSGTDFERLKEILIETPELNMANYDHEDVRKLNDALIEIYEIIYSE